MNAIFQKVEPVSKKISVIRLLKQAILSGAIQPGEQLVESRVAVQFGVGQGLLREALFELQGEGLVERTPFSGTRVATLSHEDARQIFDIRIALEPLAFELAGRSGNPVSLADLRRLIVEAREVAASQDLAKFVDCHLAFLQTVWALSGNKYLQQTLERLVVPLFAVYITRGANGEGLMQIAVECLDHYEKIVHTFHTGDTSASKQLVWNCLVLMKSKLAL